MVGKHKYRSISVVAFKMAFLISFYLFFFFFFFSFEREGRGRVWGVGGEGERGEWRV